jgi:alpha-tubulin suppressor-like RCC1 family protein
MKKVLLLLLIIFGVNVHSQCWIDVATGYTHSLGVKSDGTLWAWGSNFYGALGQGYASNINITSPVRVGTATNWSKVSVGGKHSVAIKTDGSLWAWGNNQYGQVGDGTNVNKYAPVQIGASYNWAVIECGFEFTAALKTSGDFNSWGRNESGQLGNNSTISTNAPRSIDGPHFDRLSVGYNHCAGIQYLSGGAWVYTWGNNDFGQLGRGIGPNVLGIVQISLDPYAGVVCGEGHTLFLKPDGTVIARGKNTSGQLGYNSTSNFTWAINYMSTSELIPGTAYAMPQGVSSGNGFTAIFKGTKLWTWGSNAQGQLGKGNTTNVNYPTRMDGFSSWRKVSAKGNSSSLNGIYGTWSPALNNTVTTTYTFTPQASDCAKNVTVTIYVNDPINPNGEELKYVASKVNSPSILSDFKVFPNPVRDVLNIETDLDIQSVEIYNIQGQKVLSSNQKQINVSDLAAGIYMVQIQDIENNIATKKVVIK